MKKLLFFLLLLPFFTFAQIEVHDNGRVSIGGNPAGNTSTDVYINGSAAMPFTLWVDHKNLNPNSYAINTVVYEPSCTSYRMQYNGYDWFYVQTDGYIKCWGMWHPSDSVIKEKIIRINDPLTKLNQLHGYYYHYKPYTFTQGADSGKRFPCDTLLHSGVLAQEVQKVYPQAVKRLPEGILAVDYDQLIPLLIEGIKEEDKKNNDLSSNFDLLQARYNRLAESIDTAGGVFALSPSTKNTDFILYQNSPNPFNKETTIKYDLKGSYTTAVIYIFDLSGTLKKTYSSLGNATSITVKAGDLTAGMFLYDLVVDGKEIDVKRMILTN